MQEKKESEFFRVTFSERLAYYLIADFYLATGGMGSKADYDTKTDYLKKTIWGMLESFPMDSLDKEFRDRCLEIGLPDNRFDRKEAYKKTSGIKSLGSLIGTNDANAAFFLGMQLVLAGCPKNALPWLKMASDLGVSDASNLLAIAYLRKQVERCSEIIRQKNCVFYINRAIEQNPENQRALFTMGLVKMSNFEDMPADIEASFSCFEKSSALGNPSALCVLACFYLNGLVVNEDVGKALEMLKKAADDGEMNATSLLATLFSGTEKVPKDEKEQYYWGIRTMRGELDKDPENIRKFRETAQQAENNNSEAQYQLSRYYLGDSSDVPYVVYPDYDKRAYWLEKAADNGNIDAIIHLGFCMFMPNSLLGIPYNPEKGLEYLKRGAELGDKYAMKYLCEKLLNGDQAVPQNIEQAVYWGEKSASLGGHPESLENYYIKNKMWDKYLELQIKYAEYSLNNDPETKEPPVVKKTKENRFTPVLRVGDYFFEGGSSNPEGMVVKQSFEKALEWYSRIPEKDRDHKTQKRIKICRGKLSDK